MGVLFKIRAIKCRVDMWREKNRLNQSKGLRALKCRFSLVLRIVSLDDMSLNTVFYLIFFLFALQVSLQEKLTKKNTTVLLSAILAV